MSKEEKIQEEVQNNEQESKEIEDQEVAIEGPSAEDQLQVEKDKYLRLFAEFENYKKRTIKERMELYKTASQELMTALLPIMDDFDRGLAEIKKAKDKQLLNRLLQKSFAKCYS